MFWYSGGGEMAVIADRYQDACNAAWAEMIDACAAYFLRHEPAWAGDTRAPEFTNEQVERQVTMWSGYLQDSGALNWGGDNNASRPYAHDPTKLPPAWQRALCERVYVIFDDAGLFRDADYMATARARRATHAKR